MQSVLLIIHVLMALALIGLILIQHGKGADAGAAFGSGASSTVFGSTGSASFLTRATAILAFVFFANSFLLSYLSTSGVETKSLMENVKATGETSSQTDKIVVPQQESDLPVSDENAGKSDLPAVPE